MEDLNIKVDLNVVLKAKKFELEYVQHELARIEQDEATLQYEIYEIEQIQSSNT